MGSTGQGTNRLASGWTYGGLGLLGPGRAGASPQPADKGKQGRRHRSVGTGDNVSGGRNSWPTCACSPSRNHTYFLFVYVKSVSILVRRRIPPVSNVAGCLYPLLNGHQNAGRLRMQHHCCVGHTSQRGPASS